MQQVSTKKFAEMCGVSDANIRNLISRKTLIATKDALGNNLIDIEEAKNRAYLDAKRNAIQLQKTQLAQDVSQSIESEGNQAQSQETQFAQDTLLQITQRIEELAKLAGKTEQLEMNIIEGKKDAEYWRDLYFELQHTCETLRNEKEKLFQENVTLKSENERLRKHWWNFGK